MATLSLLYKDHYDINEHIKIMIPTVGQVLDSEEQDTSYYNLVSILTSMPVDMIAELDEAGIDFTMINEYELFILMFGGLKQQDTSLIFGDLDLSNFELATSKDNGKPILIDTQSGIVIDRAIQGQIAAALRKIHHLEKNHRKPANKEAKEYMIERAKVKAKRNKRRKNDSQLESLIVAMVNTEQFKYNFNSVRDMTIYQFNESVKQIIHKIDYEHRMHGVYAGTVDAKKMSQEDFNWLSHK